MLGSYDGRSHSARPPNVTSPAAEDHKRIAGQCTADDLGETGLLRLDDQLGLQDL